SIFNLSASGPRGLCCPTIATLTHTHTHTHISHTHTHTHTHTLRSYVSPRSISGAIQKAEPTNDNFLSLAGSAGSSTTSLARPKSVTKASLPRAVTRIRQFCK